MLIFINVGGNIYDIRKIQEQVNLETVIPRKEKKSKSTSHIKDNFE